MCEFSTSILHPPPPHWLWRYTMCTTLEQYVDLFVFLWRHISFSILYLTLSQHFSIKKKGSTGMQRVLTFCFAVDVFFFFLCLIIRSKQPFVTEM